MFNKIKKGKGEAEAIPKEIKTARDIVNVKDIKGNFLYTLDGNICAYIRISPISIDLLSNNEKVALSRQITAQLSQEQKPFKFLAVSRPVDISRLVNDYQAMINENAVGVRKALLKQEIKVISEYATGGDVIERQFYLMVWDKADVDEADFRKRATDLANRISSGNVRADVIAGSDIIQLCNLINNPAYAHLEDNDASPSMPFIGGTK
jgi:hypothetical protein